MTLRLYSIYNNIGLGETKGMERNHLVPLVKLFLVDKSLMFIIVQLWYTIVLRWVLVYLQEYIASVLLNILDRVITVLTFFSPFKLSYRQSWHWLTHFT